MQVNLGNNSMLSFQAYKPLSKYKGILLELTEGDKEQIANLQSQITSLECNMYEYSTLHKAKKRTSDVQERTFKAYSNYALSAIEDLREKIREIKIHRFNIQKALNLGKKLSFEQLV